VNITKDEGFRVKREKIGNTRRQTQLGTKQEGKKKNPPTRLTPSPLSIPRNEGMEGKKRRNDK